MIYEKEDTSRKEDPQESPKKIYEAPKLTSHGSLKEITKGGRYGLADGTGKGST
jgi:hypothetical protein